MAPTLAVLVRHGLTPTTGIELPGRRPGLHLSAEGAEEARATAERIGRLVAAGIEVAAVYSSPLERARETAAPIAAALGLRVRSAPGLIECDFGEMTGGKLAELAKRTEWAALQHWPSGWSFPGGESFVELNERVHKAVRRMVAAHPGKAFVAVSHADPIKALVVGALGMHLDAFQRVSVLTASVNVIAYHQASSGVPPRVLVMNDCGGLGAIGRAIRVPSRSRERGHGRGRAGRTAGAS